MLKVLTSVHLTIILLILLIITCVSGTVIIQKNSIQIIEEKEIINFYTQEYGRTLGKIIDKLELNNLFYSNWFSGLLIFFVINLSLCTVKNLSFKFIKLGFILTHLSIIIILIGVVIGNLYGDKGFVWIQENQTVDYYISTKYQQKIQLPFKIQLKNFKLEFYKDNKSISAISDYISDIKIIDGNKEENYTIKVNSPLNFKGYKIYQQSYSIEKEKYSGFELVKDPGLFVVYIGFLFLVLGILFIFYIKPFLKKRLIIQEKK